jgi:ParB-like chromosome segregation protein Spo0J
MTTITTTTPETALRYHSFANAFPLMTGVEFNELIADIKAHDLREPITLYQGKILDGRNRYRACLRLKREPRFKEFKGDDEAARAFVISENIVRRHLTAKAKRDVIAALLKASPEKSDREIGRLTKTDKNTVASVRAKEEARGEIHHVSTRTDTAGRRQPAKKKRRRPIDDFKREIATKKATATVKPAGPAVRDPVTPDDELALLREFARFVLAHDGLRIDVKERAEWASLRDRVRATLRSVP